MVSEISLDGEKIIIAAEELVSADLSGEVAILHLDSGIYYGLNEVGTFIWDLIQKPKSVDQINEAVLEEFDVTVEQCQADVSKLLVELAKENLIKIRDVG